MLRSVHLKLYVAPQYKVSINDICGLIISESPYTTVQQVIRNDIGTQCTYPYSGPISTASTYFAFINMNDILLAKFTHLHEKANPLTS